MIESEGRIVDEAVVSKQVMNILMDLFQIKEQDLCKNKCFRKDYGLDSINMVNLLVAIEDNYKVRFDPIHIDLTEVFSSIDTLVKFIVKKGQNNL